VRYAKVAEKFMIKSAILDSDLALRLGNVTFARAIEEIIPNIIEILYIHEYVFSKEILYPQTVKEQLQSLVNSGNSLIVNRETILNSCPERLVTYDNTIRLLRDHMKDTRQNGKNWGETLSLSYAKAMGIPYILSDESKLQNVVDMVLNLGDEEVSNPDDIKVLRISDFIILMKSSGNFKRKFAKATWVASGLPARTFDTQLWPKPID